MSTIESRSYDYVQGRWTLLGHEMGCSIVQARCTPKGSRWYSDVGYNNSVLSKHEILRVYWLPWLPVNEYSCILGIFEMSIIRSFIRVITRSDWCIFDISVIKKISNLKEPLNLQGCHRNVVIWRCTTNFIDGETSPSFSAHLFQ